MLFQNHRLLDHHGPPVSSSVIWRSVGWRQRAITSFLVCQCPHRRGHLLPFSNWETFSGLRSDFVELEGKLAHLLLLHHPHGLSAQHCRQTCRKETCARTSKSPSKSWTVWWSSLSHFVENKNLCHTHQYVIIGFAKETLIWSWMLPKSFKCFYIMKPHQRKAPFQSPLIPLRVFVCICVIRSK